VVKDVFLLFAVGLASFQFATFEGHAQVKEPLTLIQTIELQEVPTFPFAGDLLLDMKGHRLFAAMQGAKSVMVIDVNTGKVIHKIPVEYPHTVLYLENLDQLYVTDQGSTEHNLKIFDARDYHLVKTLKLQARPDAGEYDPHSKYFYVDNGGAAANLDYSLISIVDTTKGEPVGDIKIPAKTLEAMVLEDSSSRLYVNIRDKDQVALVDRDKRTFLEAWAITKGKSPAAIALDEKHHRLFVGCRSSDMHGNIVVFDTQTGHEIDSLPIGGMVDDLVFDAASGQLYASCGSGEVDVYQQRAPDDYVLLGKAVTGIMARSGLLVPELHRYYVSVPSIGTQSAKILVYGTQ
jgi:YVTN family beta-propeller protein